jgi:hypothetical protein
MWPLLIVKSSQAARLLRLKICTKICTKIFTKVGKIGTVGVELLCIKSTCMQADGVC